MEIWRDIKGYEGMYQVSDKGRVRSLDRLVEGGGGSRRYFKGGPRKLNRVGGYRQVTLFKNGIREMMLVHRLVATAFIENPENKETVNHINGVKSANHIENLEWATYKENHQHARDTGLIKPTYNNKYGNNQGEKHNQSKLTEKDVRFILNNVRANGGVMTHRELARLFGLSKGTISAVVARKTWKHVSW